MADARARVNPLDAVRPAGRAYVGRDESAAYCMSMEGAKPTPEKLKKFTTLSDPGTRVRHFGFRTDPVDESRVYGSVDRRGKSSSAEALDMSKPPMAEYMAERAEAQFYKSVKAAPLGHVSVGGGFQKLPDRTGAPGFAFGAPSSKGNAAVLTAKDVIFPPDEDPAAAAERERLYAKSHGTLPPGEQKRHGVRWEATGMDPDRTAFGRKATSGDHNVMGAILNPEIDELDAPSSRVVPKSVVDFRDGTGDAIGVSRPRCLVDAADKARFPETFGRPSRRHGDVGDWGAADCLRGDYTVEEMEPDADLGRPVHAARRPGVAAAMSHVPHPDRRFGVPSIRTDVPARHGQSVASLTDFGLGTGAGQLLQPSPYAERGVDEGDFAAPRRPGELRDIFTRAGHALPDAEFAAIYARACTLDLTPRGNASVEEFRRALDEVLEAAEEGREPAWLAAALGRGSTERFGLGAAAGTR